MILRDAIDHYVAWLELEVFCQTQGERGRPGRFGVGRPTVTRTPGITTSLGSAGGCQNLGLPRHHSEPR
jgi:hypothetical protein